MQQLGNVGGVQSTVPQPAMEVVGQSLGADPVVPVRAFPSASSAKAVPSAPIGYELINVWDQRGRPHQIMQPISTAPAADVLNGVADLGPRGPVADVPPSVTYPLQSRVNKMREDNGYELVKVWDKQGRPHQIMQPVSAAPAADIIHGTISIPNMQHHLVQTPDPGMQGVANVPPSTAYPLQSHVHQMRKDGPHLHNKENLPPHVASFMLSRQAGGQNVNMSYHRMQGVTTGASQPGPVVNSAFALQQQQFALQQQRAGTFIPVAAQAAASGMDGTGRVALQQQRFALQQQQTVAGASRMGNGEHQLHGVPAAYQPAALPTMAYGYQQQGPGGFLPAALGNVAAIPPAAGAAYQNNAQPLPDILKQKSVCRPASAATASTNGQGVQLIVAKTKNCDMVIVVERNGQPAFTYPLESYFGNNADFMRNDCKIDKMTNLRDAGDAMQYYGIQAKNTSFTRRKLVFVHAIQGEFQDQLNTHDNRERWCQHLARFWNSAEIQRLFKYPETCKYGGDLTPQDESTAQPISHWLTIRDTMDYILQSYPARYRTPVDVLREPTILPFYYSTDLIPQVHDYYATYAAPVLNGAPPGNGGGGPLDF